MILVPWRVSVVLLAAAASAQEPPLSLGEALDLAISRPTAVRQAAIATAQRREALRSATGAFEPTARGSLSADRTDNDLRRSGGAVSSASIGASLGWDFTPRNLPARRAARLSLDAAGLSEAQSRDDAVAEAAVLFLDALDASHRVEVERASLDAQVRQLSLVQAFREQGRKALSDELQQKALVSQGEARVLEAEHAVATARMRLFDLLGLPLRSMRALSDGEIGELAQALAADSADSGGAGKPGTAGLRAQAANVEAARAALEAARLARMPVFGVSAGLSANRALSGAGSEDAEWGTRGTVGASISIPLLDQQQSSTARARAALDLRSAELSLSDGERAAELELERAFLERRVARRQAHVAADRVAAAEQALEAVRERYAVGAATLAEVSTLEAQALDARLSAIDARTRIVAAWIAALHRAGRLGELRGKLGSTGASPAAGAAAKLGAQGESPLPAGARAPGAVQESSGSSSTPVGVGSAGGNQESSIAAQRPSNHGDAE